MAAHAFQVNFTPPGVKSGPAGSASPAPVLQLRPFQRPPIVSFGTVKVGAVKCVNLVLANDLDRPVQVSVQKVPEASGFSIADGQVVVEANMEAALTIQWKPAEAGNVRGVLSLTTDTALRLQCILLGSGKAPAVKKGKRPTKPGATSRCAIPLQTLSVNTAVARPVTACVRDSRASANTTITTSSAVTRAVSPLNSTHFLETGCESAGVKNRLRTPPDLSVSAISSVDADSVARRQTFVVKDGPAPSATDLETPLRRLTFLRDTENVPPVTGEGRAPISCDPALLETPPELRRRTTYTAEAVPVTVKQEAVVNSIGADKLSVLPTPVLFPRTVRCKAEPLSPIVSDEENDSAARQPEPIAIGDFLQTPQLFGRTYKCAVSRESRGFAPLTSSPHHDSPLLECMPVARVSTPHAATVSAGVADDPQCSPALSPRSSENRHLAVVEPKVVPPPRLTPTSTCATQSADRTFTIGTTGGVQAVEGGIITSEVKTELATEHDDIGRVPDLVISSTPQTHDSAAIATISTAGAAELPAAMFVPFDSPSAHQMATPISRRQRLVSHLEQRRRGHTPKRLTLPVTPGRRRRASNLSAKRERPVLSSSVRPRVVAKAAARVSVPRRPASLRLISAAQKTRSAQIPLVQPSVFLNRGSLYDKDWAEKRGRGLAAWINMILTPSEEFRSTAVEKRVDSARLMVDLTQSHVPPAPSAETLSLRAYTAVRLLNRLRQRAFKLYESAAMVTVLSKIDTAVEQGSIKVRKDRALHVDIGLKQMVVGLLINYHPLWLRLGLETVYGMVIHTRSTDDLTTLVRFIIDRLLWNPQLAAQFSHRSVPHLYTAELEPILKRFALKNLIMLVYFLDVAKRNRLIRHDPCLFNKHAPIKASQEILVAISRELLAGEGCIVKHLSYLGLTVSHVQTKLDEFDYGVNNIAVDLRCGVRLARLIETLTNSPLSLRERLRAPAVDRHQKLYNLKLAVEASGLQLQQLSPAALARQLLDGHKEATLNIIWQLAVKYEIGSADGIVELDKELIALQKSLDNHCFIGNKAAVEGRRLRQQLPSVSESLDTTMNCARTQGSVSASAESSVLSAELTNQLVTCAGRLLSWCRLVCAHYGVSVGNLSSSLRDGRVYCLLLHHYQPLLLPLHSVHQQTADSRIVHTAADSNDDDGDDFQYPSQQIDSKQLAALSRNEKANVALALNVMTQLGGVAVLHTAVDFASFPPDWQLVVLQLKLLSCRLLQLGREQSAARRLQLWWRRHLYCRQLRKQQVRQKSST